jgi:hypothetical protein
LPRLRQGQIQLGVGGFDAAAALFPVVVVYFDTDARPAKLDTRYSRGKGASIGIDNKTAGFLNTPPE